MADLDHIHAALASLHPSVAFGDYLWARQNDETGAPVGEPVMLRWDEARFGPLDMAALAAECRRIATTPAVPASISDRQFAQVLALDGVISEDEALAWASRGELPIPMESALAQLPEGQLFAARMLLSSATSYERGHPLVPMLGALLGYDAAALDDIWVRAAAL